MTDSADDPSLPRRDQRGEVSSAPDSDESKCGLIFSGRMHWLFVALGYICLGVGIAGIFLPLLPTTPFLLLASFCFLRSSPAAYRRLLAHPWAGPFLRDWQTHRAIRLSAKRTAIVTVLAAMACTLWLARSAVTIQLLTLAGCGIGLAVIARLPVIPDQPPDVLPTDQVGSHRIS